MEKKSLLKYLLIIAIVLFNSCSSDDGGEVIKKDLEPDKTVSELTINTLTGLDVLKGEKTTLIVKNKKGENVTAKASIFVNNVKIKGASYNFSGANSYKVYAQIDQLKTPVVSINVVTPTHTTKLLIEEYVALWCPYCPRMKYKLDKLSKANSKVIPVALHYDKKRKDGVTFPEVLDMRTIFKVRGYPVGRLNRIHTWKEKDKQIQDYLAKKKNLGLAIKSSISGDELSAEIKVHYDVKSITKNKLVVYLLENGLIIPQANYYNNDSSSPWYKKGNPIKNFEHKYIARTTLTDKLGDVIPENEIKTGATYKKSFKIKIPKKIKDKSKLELVAFVVDDKKEVINVQKAKVGANKDFD